MQAPIIRTPSATRAFGSGPQTRCPLCNKELKTEVDIRKMIMLKKLKPRFVRQIKRQYPNKHLKDLSTLVCYKDLHTILQNRIDFLLEQDQSSFAKMQEEAMRNLENYENREDHWQDMFDSKRNRSERWADKVALNAGSWTFVTCVLLFIGLWAVYDFLDH